ncbi:MAG TPA: hypothetical protein VKV28_09875 [Candidatus Binataceae bacterium]|nr:hypothetical protein [Candidatus Binataceae bacterium]
MDKDKPLVDVPRVNMLEPASAVTVGPKGAARSALIGVAAAVLLIGAAVWVGASVRNRGQVACEVAVPKALAQIRDGRVSALDQVAAKTDSADPNSVYVARMDRQLAVVGSGRFECEYCSQNAATALDNSGLRSFPIEHHPTALLVCADHKALDLGGISQTVAQTLEMDPSNTSRVSVHTLD